MPKTAVKSFEATLEHGGAPLNWTIIRIPFDVSAVWGKRGQLRVRGDINGFGFRTSLFPTGDGHHVLLVNKHMQKGGRAGVGITARFRLEPDTEERKIDIPRGLEEAFHEDRALRRWYDQLNPSTRYEISKWVMGVKSPDAQARRTGQIVDRMLATMDAERDLPPLLRAAFARDARAEEGWKRMSPSHRRAHLMAIFYYRTPEARARRAAKVLQEARAYAEKRSRVIKSEPAHKKKRATQA